MGNEKLFSAESALFIESAYTAANWLSAVVMSFAVCSSQAGENVSGGEKID